MYKAIANDTRFKKRTILYIIITLLPLFPNLMKRKPYSVHGLLAKSTNLVATTRKDYHNLIMSSNNSFDYTFLDTLF